jgi:anti-sigma B factor antagonist
VVSIALTRSGFSPILGRLIGKRMNTAPARLLVAIADPVVFIRISGRANFAVSVDFKTLMQELYARGYREFTLDLTDCLIMDSTFLGLLAGFSLKMKPASAHKPAIRLLNPNERIADGLETMGIMSLFEMLSGATPLAAYAEAAPGPPASRVELTRTSLEAHQTLMAISAANIPKFKDVARFLAEDLHKMEAKPGIKSNPS